MILAIAIEHPSWTQLGDVQTLFERAARAAVAAIGIALAPDCELSLLLSDDDALRALNRTFRGQDKPTNVLSFPQGSGVAGSGPGPQLLGDIALAFETVAREAHQQDKTLADHASHLMVHGVLHLLGYDHANDADALKMEALERDILVGIGVADPYGVPQDADI